MVKCVNRIILSAFLYIHTTIIKMLRFSWSECNFLIIYITLFLCMCILPCNTQGGTECSSIIKCMPHQTCYLGYCKCDEGYIKAELHCFPIRSHGETCFYDNQCVDHRMSCRTNDSSPQKRCFCDNYHTWNGEECEQSLNVTALLESLQEEVDYSKLNTKSEHEMFIKISVVGLISVITILTFIMCCVAYGCCSCTRTDEATACPPTCPLHKVPLLQEDMQKATSNKGQPNWNDVTAQPIFDDIEI